VPQALHVFVLGRPIYLDNSLVRNG